MRADHGSLGSVGLPAYKGERSSPLAFGHAFSPALLPACAVYDTAERFDWSTCVALTCGPFPVLPTAAGQRPRLTGTHQSPHPVRRASSLPSRAPARLSKVQERRISPTLLPAFAVYLALTCGPFPVLPTAPGQRPHLTGTHQAPHPVRRASSLSKVQEGRISPALLPPYASILLTTFPSTSVRRKSRPMW